MARKGWEDKFNELKTLSEQQIDQKIKEYQYYSQNPSKIPESKVSENKLKDKDGKPLEQKDKRQVLKKSIDKELLTLESFKKNKDKIERYIKYRDTLHEQIAKMSKGPLQDVVKMEEINKKKLEIQNKIQAKMAELNAEAAKNDKDPKKLAKINSEITQLAHQKENNLHERIECQKRLDEAKKNGLDGMPFEPKNMMKTFKDMQAATVKCDMICSLLMQGKGINDLHFDRTKVTYRAPKRFEKMMEDEEARGEEQESGEQQGQEHQEGEQEGHQEGEQEGHQQEERAELPETVKFDFRHPIKSIKRMIEQRRARKAQENHEEEHEEPIDDHEIDKGKEEASFRDLAASTRAFLENDGYAEEVGEKDDFRDSLKVRKSETNLEQISRSYEERALKETDPAKKAMYEAKAKEYSQRAAGRGKSGLTDALLSQEETARQGGQTIEPKEGEER